MNYSETYFKLDSEMPLTVIIVTLSALKGMSRRSIQSIKAMLLCIVYGILFVDTVNMKIKACFSRLSILVFVALTQHCIQSTMRCENSTLLCIKWPLTPPRGKATVDLLCLPSYGFSCSPVWGGSYVNFLGLVNYKGDCR